MTYDMECHQAGTILIDFLQRLNTIKIMQSKVIATYFRFNRLVKFGKRNFKNNQIKKEKIRFIMDTELATLMTNLRKSGKAKDKEKEELLLDLNNEDKTIAINEYLDRCKLRHSILYYKWRQEHLDELQSKLIPIFIMFRVWWWKQSHRCES